MLIFSRPPSLRGPKNQECAGESPSTTAKGVAVRVTASRVVASKKVDRGDVMIVEEAGRWEFGEFGYATAVVASYAEQSQKNEKSS